MSDHAAKQKWQEAQVQVLLEEFRVATGNTAGLVTDAEQWFARLPLTERDRVGRRMNDPKIVGWHLQTPKIA
jgi:hypothetical protein